MLDTPYNLDNIAMTMKIKMKQIAHHIFLPFLTSLRIIFFYFAAPIILTAVILFNAIDNVAITDKNWTLSSSDLQRAKHIIKNTTSTKQKTIKLTEKDINIALSYLLNHYISSTSQLSLNKGQLHFKISLLLNDNILGKFINLNFKLSKQQGYPVINSLQIGNISIANEFAGLILENIIKYTPLKEYYILAAQHIKNIQLNKNSLSISYITPSELNFKKKLSLNNKNYQTVIFYQQQITHIIAQHDPKWRLSLTELLQPLFKLAYQRSTEKNAISENRATLIAISTYVNKSEIQAYIPFDISPTTDKQYPASLYQRTDMAKHFVASAVLAASGATTLANILGQEKELNDAKQGSGFSFIDLAGDRAGLKFGQMATSSPAQAREIQKQIADLKHYTAFMPEVRDLPENMNEEVFKQRYESVYSAKYQKMLQKIDLRISELPIYLKQQQTNN